ncbi:MAG: hypothetical protein FJ404_13775 [Verrucomicrobia bacterium]|nr:hypothetical protein [Verrucomicrobiota bacterium]
MPSSPSLLTDPGKFNGKAIDLLGVGKVRLAKLISLHSETSVYRTDRPDVVVKMFDLDCGKPDEVSYGPYVGFNLEKENFEAINRVESLKRCIPSFYGADIDYANKCAWIAMEFLQGQNLVEWSQSAASGSAAQDWTEHFREAIHEALAIMTQFHRHGIVLIDFKPDNVIRLHDRRIKFVDLGAFWIPRQTEATDQYVYSATPDYSELVIDTANIETGIPLNSTSDIFAAGVALFEITTGSSRLRIPDETAEFLLRAPELYLFRDSQIRDVWKAYPHLEEGLPLVETQLKDRHVLFAEVWHLIKGLLAHEVEGWDNLGEEERQQAILDQGIALIAAQMPPALVWLADPVARSTTLRSLRLGSISELMDLVAVPVAEEVRQDVLAHNGLIRLAGDMGQSSDFVQRLNVWDLRWEAQSAHWSIRTPFAALALAEMAPFIFLKTLYRDAEGHTFYQIVTDTDADTMDGTALTLARLSEDHFAWIGG